MLFDTTFFLSFLASSHLLIALCSTLGSGVGRQGLTSPPPWLCAVSAPLESSHSLHVFCFCPQRRERGPVPRAEGAERRGSVCGGISVRDARLRKTCQILDSYRENEHVQQTAVLDVMNKSILDVRDVMEVAQLRGHVKSSHDVEGIALDTYVRAIRYLIRQKHIPSQTSRIAHPMSAANAVSRSFPGKPFHQTAVVPRPGATKQYIHTTQSIIPGSSRSAGRSHAQTPGRSGASCTCAGPGRCHATSTAASLSGRAAAVAEPPLAAVAPATRLPDRLGCSRS